MSQHILRTRRQDGTPVEILIGWDRPLKRHFMVVETVAQAEGNDNEYLYDNLADPNAPDRDLDYYRQRLRELQIEVPATLFEQVALDAAANTGNRRVRYATGGTFQEES